MSARWGISLNLAKCKLWGPPFAPGLDIPGLSPGCALSKVPRSAYVPGSGLKVLGIPVCHPRDFAFANGVWRERVQSHACLCDAVAALPDAQIQYCLLRMCLSACRVMDLLRACPLGSAEDACGSMSQTLRTTFGRIAGVGLCEDQWTHATLAIRQGGFGLQDPMVVRPAARLSTLVAWAAGGSRECTCPHGFLRTRATSNKRCHAPTPSYKEPLP